MNNRRKLDRATIEEAFRIMGQYLLDRHVLGEIAIYGGNVILFQFDWARTSDDVDVHILSGSHHGVIMHAAEAASQQLGLPRSWLNDSVAMYARRHEEDRDRTFIGVYPSPERVGLRVLAAKPSYILAMMGAMERTTLDDRDFSDAVELGLSCGVRTVDELRNVFREYFPDRELPTRTELCLSEVAQAIASRSGS